MDRYQRVERPREEIPINENEIRITAQGRMRSYITYATSLLQERGSNKIVFKAMGRAINKTVMIVELIKRRVVGLHQNTEIGSTDITDTWEPLEEGLLPIETTRHVSMITITLSKEELDTFSPGYQLPIPMEQVRPLVEFEHEGEDLSAGRGRGRGGHIHGRDRGNGFMVMDYNDEGWNHVHGRGGQNRGRGRGFRGRGRGGYGGRTYYQQENGGYNEEYSVPVQGRGRGRGRARTRPRGRGQGQGRGRDFRSNGPIHAEAVGA